MVNHMSNILRDRNKARKNGNGKKAELPTELSDSIKKPFDAFWNIYSDDLLDIITTQTNIYANQHKVLNAPATTEEIKVVISILILSGYCRVPYCEL